jgi:hypothetical protein
LEEWSPLYIILLIAIFPFLLAGFLFYLLIYNLPPVLFLPLAAFALIGTYLYLKRVYKYYEERKLKKLFASTLVFALILITPYPIYIILAPNWSLKVTTDKATYRLGESVNITITLANRGYVTHTFPPERIEGGFVVTVLGQTTGSQTTLWWIRLGFSDTVIQNGVTLEAGHALERNVFWDQTNTEDPYYCPLGPISKTGNYTVHAETEFDFGDSTTIVIEP